MLLQVANNWAGRDCAHCSQGPEGAPCMGSEWAKAFSGNCRVGEGDQLGSMPADGSRQGRTS